MRAFIGISCPVKVAMKVEEEAKKYDKTKSRVVFEILDEHFKRKEMKAEENKEGLSEA